ncbi:MAG: hypothetical protein IPJ88_03420 [Myxococcales bacterium]|nr:MAG: hypothetical protein IPJ88_03420 [Myxococcales bacterium]
MRRCLDPYSRLLGTQLARSLGTNAALGGSIVQNYFFRTSTYLLLCAGLLTQACSLENSTDVAGDNSGQQQSGSWNLSGNADPGQPYSFVFDDIRADNGQNYGRTFVSNAAVVLEQLPNGDVRVSLTGTQLGNDGKYYFQMEFADCLFAVESLSVTFPASESVAENCIATKETPVVARAINGTNLDGAPYTLSVTVQRRGQWCTQEHSVKPLDGTDYFIELRFFNYALPKPFHPNEPARQSIIQFNPHIQDLCPATPEQITPTSGTAPQNVPPALQEPCPEGYATLEQSQTQAKAGPLAVLNDSEESASSCVSLPHNEERCFPFFITDSQDWQSRGDPLVTATATYSAVPNDLFIVRTYFECDPSHWFFRSCPGDSDDRIETRGVKGCEDAAFTSSVETQMKLKSCYWDNESGPFSVCITGPAGQYTLKVTAGH